MIYKKYRIFSKLFSVMWKDTRQTQLRLIAGISLVVVGSLLNLLLPWCLKLIVEYFNQPGLYNILIFLLVSYGIIWLVSHLMISLRQIIIYRAFEKGIHKFTSEVFQKILNLSMKYHVSNTTGNIMNSIERAQMSIPTILYGLMFIIFPMIIEITIAAGFLCYYYGIAVAGILLLIFLIYTIFTWGCIPRVVETQRKGNKCHQRVSDYITDVLMNIEGVCYQAAQAPVTIECEKKMMDRENAMTKQLVCMDMVSLGQTLITSIGFVCMTLLVGFGVMHSKLVATDFILINGYLIQLLVPLSVIGVSVLRNVRESFTRMEDVMDLLNEKEDIIDRPLAKEIKRQNPIDIAFNNVAFIYPGREEYTLKNISFYLPEGKSLAIVGANGAGKSTITKLVYRLFDVSRGQITIQGEDIRNIKLAELRRLIGIVPQEIFLLNDTIYSNLLFGLGKDISESIFKKVVQLTNIETWVNNLPEKYMTMVGERGVKLSGGEKKRLGIARTLLRDPTILVLDEAMASLDVDTEYQIFNHICENYNRLTRIIITHHAKYLSSMDAVIYLENGLISAYGRHTELLEQNEHYRKLWQKQENQFLG